MGAWLKRQRQKRAAKRAVKQATDLQSIYANAGMTPDQVNAINSQVANIGGATRQQVNAAAQTDGGGDAASQYAAPYTGDDQSGNDPFSDESNNPDDFFDVVERMNVDPVYAMVRYNKLVGKGSEAGKNYSEKWEDKQYFEDYDGGGLGSMLGGDIDAILGQFSKNFDDNKPSSFDGKENFFGINFKKLFGGKKKKDDDDSSLESFDISETVMEYLPALILAYVGYHFYGYTGAIVAGIAGYFAFKKKVKDGPENNPDLKRDFVHLR